MRTVILASMRGHARRYVAAALAVGLGVMFVATALVVLSTVKAGLTQAVAAKYERADLVLLSGEGSVGADLVSRLRQLDGVAAAAGVAAPTNVRVAYQGEVRPQWLTVTALPTEASLRWQHVDAGRLPAALGEVAIDASRAEDHGLRPGSTLAVTDIDGNRHRVRVVGILPPGTLGEDSAAVATERTVAAWDARVVEYTEVLVRTESGGTRDDVVAAAVAKTAGSGATVVTAEARAGEVARSLTGGVDIAGALLLGFAGVAAFVAVLVVANTFTIVLAQRTRELALLRCVGARGGQLVGSVLAESALLGLAASVVGTAAGCGAAVVAAGLLSTSGIDLPLSGIDVPPALLAVPMAVGVAMTVLAALAPARRATRVSPLAALRPEPVVEVRSRAGYIRIALAAVALVAGTGVMLLGAGSGEIVAGVAGGALSFLGVLASGPLLVPAVVRLLGTVTRAVGGVPARLAVSNAVRNPRRTAATSTALLVGVTLIVLMTVGAASVQRSVQNSLDKELPVDISLSATAGGVPDRTLAAARAVDGVGRSVVLREAEVRATTAAGGTGRGEGIRVTGVDPRALATVVRSPALGQGLRPGVALVAPTLAGRLGVESGGDLVLTSAGRRLEVLAQVVANPATPDVVLAQADLSQLAPNAVTSGLWARVADGADPRTVVADLGEAVADTAQNASPTAGGIELGGGAPQRMLFEQVLDVMLLVAACLLAVAVVIALVGVGNTLSLSVIERTREQALLRALGLTRGQLRRTLAVEALLVAGVAVAVGIPLGLLYGWAGTATLLGAAIDEEVLLAVPVGRLALIAGVALLAGLLASVLPARRAVRVSPAAALATE
jgi:putative ABC transport system permease protein